MADDTPNSHAPQRHSSADGRASEKKVARAAAILRWIGRIGIAYVAIAYCVALAEKMRDPPVDTPALIVVTVGTVFFLALFIAMTRIAQRLPTDFDRMYWKVQWVGMLSGVLGYPILTIPAFYAVWLVATQHRAVAWQVSPAAHHAKTLGIPSKDSFRYSVKATLIITQAFGGLAIMAWPILAVGYAMACAGIGESISRHGLTFPRGLMLVLMYGMLFHPWIWLLAYGASWMAFQRARFISAIILSIVPFMHVLSVLVVDQLVSLRP
jgi:hypothetical protein